jgi:hypothetical protein
VDVPVSAFKKFESLPKLLSSILGKSLGGDTAGLDARVATPKVMPVLTTDAEAEEFVETANLAEYDLSEFKPATFKFEN